MSTETNISLVIWPCNLITHPQLPGKRNTIYLVRNNKVMTLSLCDKMGLSLKSQKMCDVEWHFSFLYLSHRCVIHSWHMMVCNIFKLINSYKEKPTVTLLSCRFVRTCEEGVSQKHHHDSSGNRLSHPLHPLFLSQPAILTVATAPVVATPKRHY